MIGDETNIKKLSDTLLKRTKWEHIAAARNYKNPYKYFLMIHCVNITRELIGVVKLPFPLNVYKLNSLSERIVHMRRYYYNRSKRKYTKKSGELKILWGDINEQKSI